LINGSDRLAGAREELSYISKYYGGNAAILGAADLPQLRSSVAHSDLIHFSGHAVALQGRPALLLQSYPQKVYVDCPTINSWRLERASLINLAGCSTGIGPLAEGEAPWGLVPAFLNAGAPAIIASLMPVDDAATQQLSFHFYDLLKKGNSKAQALRGAQLDLLAQSRKNAQMSPRSWIPFVLIGNPQ